MEIELAMQPNTIHESSQNSNSEVKVLLLPEQSNIETNTDADVPVGVKKPYYLVKVKHMPTANNIWNSNDVEVTLQDWLEKSYQIQSDRSAWRPRLLQKMAEKQTQYHRLQKKYRS